MADGYSSWSESRDTGTYRLPGPEHLGWWAFMAMLASLMLHVAVFFMLDRMKIALRFEQTHELSTHPINVRQVEVRPMELEKSPPPENVVTPPRDTAALLEEVDLLNALPKNQEIDIKPDIRDAEYALQMKNPAMQGDPAAIAMDVTAGMDLDSDLKELGRQTEHLKPAEVGQVTVDPGAAQLDDHELGKYTDNLLKRGAKGRVEKGALDGVASLDDLLDLPPNLLLGKKTLLPSDLLFEFNSAELRESAKVGLMKLALLMDRNPQLYCWIEGHTDLVGGDEFNLALSNRRAEAVKTYLTEAFRMDGTKISTRGLGRYHPLVIRGTAEEQAINRRVEIRMRNTPAPQDQLSVAPQKPPIIEAPPAESPPALPKAILVKPKRVPQVEEDPPPARPIPPRATPVKELEPLPQVPKAMPIEPEPPPAIVIPPSAQPVDDSDSP